MQTMPKQTETSPIPLWVEDIESAWDFAAPLVQRALDEGRGEETVDSIKQALIEGTKQLWLIGDKGICVTSIEICPAARILRAGQLAGHDFDEWMVRLHYVLTEFAKLNDCQYIDIVGRHGWPKKLQKLGYERTYTVTSYVVRRN